MSKSQKDPGPSVLISGASFAGLSSAWWMSRLGYAVTIVEMASELRRGGTPVNIRDEVIDVVRRMCLLDRIKALALPARAVTFLDPEGRPLQSHRLEEHAAEMDEEYEIERDALLEMLFDEVDGKVEFVFGDSILTADETGDQVDIVFVSGRKQSFSLLLGCDGIHSTVRRLCFGEEGGFAVFLKNYFAVTIVPKLLMEENTSVMFSVPGKSVFLNTYNSKTDIGFGFSSTEEIPYDRKKQAEQKSMIRKVFEGGKWRTEDLLNEMSASDNFYFDKLCQIQMDSWTTGRVALVGDAGYSPSPAAGMGGSVAILGAAALGQALEKHPDDVTAAFREYNDTFHPVIERIQAQAVDFGMAMFLPSSQEDIRSRNEQFGLL